MKRWEYKVVIISISSNSSKGLGEELSEYGRDGWELVMIDTESWIAFFKRELLEEKS